jgi:rhamnulokinase
MSQYVAFDLGAESGRAMLGTVTSERIEIGELHRFANTPVQVFQSLYWDTLRLWHEIGEGLRIAARERRLKIRGVGVDTWGVDFALLGADGALLENPRHYRDPRNNGMVEKLFETVPREEIFERTGIQFMQLNSLCQLYAMKLAGSPALASAQTLLFMPDLFNYWLTGVARCELTIASTSEFYNPREKKWAAELLERFDLPKQILPEIVPPGQELAPMLDSVASRAGFASPPAVFATASHDTASAVAAAPAEGADWCYISSGTWSLQGAEVDAPVINAASLKLNFTNEVGYGGKIRLLKNIAGLWLLQECRRAWALEGANFTYEELARAAADVRRFAAIIDPDAFLEPGDMPKKIAEHCRFWKQDTPGSPPEFTRVILESLALRYRAVLESMERLLGRRFRVIHIVGGGSRNRLLNQFAADCTGRPVIAGPAEATAIGNVLIQALAAGELASHEEARALVRQSFPMEIHEPGPVAGWDEAYERYQKIARR